MLSRLGSDDGRVEGQQVGLLGDVVDDVEDVADGEDFLPSESMTWAAVREESLIFSMPARVFCSAPTPEAASEFTSSASLAVSLAFISTWPMETSISFMDEEVSSVDAERSSTFLATSLMLKVICSMAEVVSSTDAARATMFSTTSSLVAAISTMEEDDSSGSGPGPPRCWRCP